MFDEQGETAPVSLVTLMAFASNVVAPIFAPALTEHSGNASSVMPVVHCI